MSDLTILFAVLTLGWLPLDIVDAGKLKTEDIETANSIIQRLHKLQERTLLNERIKKQRLEEVNNHNERVKFLHKLSQGAQELYAPEEKKGVNDLLQKFKIVDINDKRINSNNNLMLLQKALALLQGVTDNQNNMMDSAKLQNNQDIQRSKPTLPTLQDLENIQPVPLSLLQYESNNKPSSLSSSLAEQWNRDNDIGLSEWKINRNNKHKEEILSSSENIPVLNENGDDNNQKSIKRYLGRDREQNNLIEQVLKSLQQQQNNNKNNIQNIRWKSKNKGYYNGFLSDLNLKNSLKKYQKESEVKEPQNNYFQGSTYEETEENNKNIPDDKLDGYSKVLLVLDPEAITSKNNRNEANKIISKLSTWASNLNKYWKPKQAYEKTLFSNYGFRRRQSEHVTNENETRRKDRYKRHTTDDIKPIKVRSRNNYGTRRSGSKVLKKTTVPSH